MKAPAVRYWRPPKRNNHPERDLQIAIAQWLDWALPADFYYTAIDHTFHGERRGALLRRMGVKRGQLDMLILGPDRFVGWLENKSQTGSLTAEQHVQIPMLQAFGHRVAVCRSLDDAKAALAAWDIVCNTEKTSLRRIKAGFASTQDWPESEPLKRRKSHGHSG